MHASKDPVDLTAGTWLDGWLVAVRGARQDLTARPEDLQRSGDASWAQTVILELADELDEEVKVVTSDVDTASTERSRASWRAGHREGLSFALQVYQRRVEHSERGNEPLDDQLTIVLLHRLVADMTAAVRQAGQPSLF